MEYQTKILESLISAYERRGLYDPANRKNRQAIYLDIEKEFPQYTDLYDDAYLEINNVINHLISIGILDGKRDTRGSYHRLLFHQDAISQYYKLTGRNALGVQREQMLHILLEWDTDGNVILEQFRQAQLERLDGHKAAGFRIGDDVEKLRDVTRALSALMELETETYIRNFSTAVFADSKRFQQIRTYVENILCAYGGPELTGKTVLKTFNLLDNPTYIMLKGNLRIFFGNESIHLGSIPDGIALPSTAISMITGVQICGPALITVENLTTYHDERPGENAVLYLGGFHNSIRTDLLRKIHEQNPEKDYWHKGDIDVYGFLILENLKAKTGIPFQPLEMDLATLREFESHHLVTPLEQEDKKKLHRPELTPHAEVLSYMEFHNCKAEQEARQALKLLHGT